MDNQEKDQLFKEFDDLTNMSASELEKWLKTKESKVVGRDSGDGESVGHKSGSQIVRIKNKNRDKLTTQDYDHMQKVVGYIKRHSAQRPKEVKDSNWEYSLKNWGHDPEK